MDNIDQNTTLLSRLSNLPDATDTVDKLERLAQEVEDLRRRDVMQSCDDAAKVTALGSSEYSKKLFEQFMKQEVCLLTESRSAVYVFYNTLRHLCRKYNILLKDLTQLTYNDDIHECGPMANEAVREQMSADLYHKLESPGCLPRDNKRIESLLFSYGMMASTSSDKSSYRIARTSRMVRDPSSQRGTSAMATSMCSRFFWRPTTPRKRVWDNDTPPRNSPLTFLMRP